MKAFIILLIVQYALCQECTLPYNVTLNGNINSTECATSLCDILPSLFLPLFGPIAGPTCTYTVNTTLSADLFCHDITVNAGITLSTNGYRVFASGTLNVLGEVSNNGGDAGNAGGLGAHQGSVGGGGDGAFSALAQNGPNATALIGVTPVAGTNVGGRGGTFFSFIGGLGGPVTVSPSGTYDINYIPTWVTLEDLAGNLYAGGSGGGAGGKVNPGAGSGGGGGAGVVAIYAKTLTGTGVISANGGMGGGRAAATNNAGGGGGGGGLIVAYLGSNQFTGAFQVLGGTAGTAVNVGTNGQNGNVYVTVIPGLQ